MKNEKLLLICSAILALGAGTAQAALDDNKGAAGGTSNSFFNSNLNEGEVTLYTTLGAAQSGDHDLATIFNCVHYDPSNRLTYPVPVRLEIFDDNGGVSAGNCTVDIPDADFDPVILGTGAVPTLATDCTTMAAGVAVVIAARIVTTKKAAPYVECAASAMSTTAAPVDRIFGVPLTRVGPKLKKVKDTFVP